MVLAPRAHPRPPFPPQREGWEAPPLLRVSPLASAAVLQRQRPDGSRAPPPPGPTSARGQLRGTPPPLLHPLALPYLTPAPSKHGGSVWLHDLEAPGPFAGLLRLLAAALHASPRLASVLEAAAGALSRGLGLYRYAALRVRSLTGPGAAALGDEPGSGCLWPTLVLVGAGAGAEAEAAAGADEAGEGGSRAASSAFLLQVWPRAASLADLPACAALQGAQEQRSPACWACAARPSCCACWPR